MGKWIELCKENSTDSVDSVDSVEESASIENVEKESSPSKEKAKVKVISEVIDPPEDESARKIAYEKIEQGSTMFGLLTDVQQEAYRGWYEMMISEKHNLSPAEAHKKTAEFIAKTSKSLHILEYVERFRVQGYLKIFSIKLNKTIYLARNESVKTKLDATPGDIFLASEIQELAGLDGEELMLMLEAKEMFKGVLIEAPTPSKDLKRGGNFGMPDAEKKISK